MISIVFSTRTPNKEFQDHIKKTIGVKDFEIIEIVNNGKFSLTKAYNDGLNKAKNDIVAFIHDDIILPDGWGKKMIKHFKNSDYGILGVAGTTDMPESGKWWEDSTKMVGIVKHSHEGKTWENKYSNNFVNEIIETVIVDGLFFVVDKKKIVKPFNEDIKGFHFYDIDFTFYNHIHGVKVGVIFDVRITHKSIGMTNDEWENNRKQFCELNTEYLPHKIKPEIRYEVKHKPLKEYPKVSIIIPTKGNIELVKQCVESLYGQGGYLGHSMRTIIADTGSTPEELEELKRYVSGLQFRSNHAHFVKVVEYDFYNFAVINNDVVENHVEKDTELLLFCNNDIKVINNAIDLMVDTYLKNKKTVGTIGARLHYGDNTVQHSGIITFVRQDMGIGISHHGLRSYYNYHDSMVRDVFGNTAAFMMISKKLFDDIGGFNTSYRECFEDVELNVECINRGKENIFLGNAVCYHYESQTRNKNEEKLKREGEDYTKRLIPFILKNKKTYNYFSNIKAKDFEALIERSKQLTPTDIQNAFRNFV